MALGFRNYNQSKALAREKEVVSEDITHIHSNTNTAPCYTGRPWSEDIHLLGTSHTGSTGVHCYAQGYDDGGIYQLYLDTYGTSHGQTGWVYRNVCNVCGHTIPGSSTGITSGRASGTDWYFTCTHTNEKVANFSIMRKNKDLTLVAEQDHVTVSAYQWTFGSVVLSNTASCKMGGHGTYTCRVTYRDNYSNKTINKDVSYTY